MSESKPIRHTTVMTLHSLIHTCEYPHDVGNLHVIDYRLWLADLPFRRPRPGIAPAYLRISPADWSR